MPRIDTATELSVSKYKHIFAVGVEIPLYGFLEFYGNEGADDYYIWLVYGHMEGLCSGLAEAVQTAIDRGWHVYAFNNYDEALSSALLRCDKTTAEIISIYYCALVLAEHYHGAESREYRHICGELSEYYRSIGNNKASEDYAKQSQEFTPDDMLSN